MSAETARYGREQSGVFTYFLFSDKLIVAARGVTLREESDLVLVYCHVAIATRWA